MNPLRFCYVLTTNGSDEFVDMNYVSAAFLRDVHPDAEILVLCDAESHRALCKTKHPLHEVADRIEGVETPDSPPGHRNRFVKTSMRDVLRGDFAYLDGDTVPVKRLDEMMSGTSSVAGITNYNVDAGSSEVPNPERTVFETMGWAFPHGPYINGGVLVLRDAEPAYRFSRLWHEKWRAWSSHGRHTDQPSLNSALADSGIEYDVLDHRFNAQIGPKPVLAGTDVAVWHFYYSVATKLEDHNVPKTLMGAALQRFQADGRLSTRAIEQLRSMPYPWITQTPLDRWFVRRRVLTRGAIPLDSAERYWLAGYRRKAITKLLAQRLSHLGQRVRGQHQGQAHAHSIH